MKQFFNTFIIPSIGRPTLKKAIQSIFNQNAKKNETHIVVVFDNCDIVDYGIPNVTNIKTICTMSYIVKVYCSITSPYKYCFHSVISSYTNQFSCLWRRFLN